LTRFQSEAHVIDRKESAVIGRKSRFQIFNF